MSLPLTRGQVCIYSTCLWVDACFCACVVHRDGYLMTALLLTTLNDVSSVPVPDARVHVHGGCPVFVSVYNGMAG